MVTKKISQEFSWTESRILGVLSYFDKFLLKTQVRTCSVAFPGTLSNNPKNREPTGGRSLTEPYPELGVSVCSASNLIDSDQDQTHQMVTGVQEENRYCSPGTSSGKQKKAHSSSQPQFRNKNNPATIEADQFMLAL